MEPSTPARPSLAYPELVAALTKPGAALLAQMTPEKWRLLRAASTLVPRAGAVFDTLKKHAYYNQPLDTAQINSALIGLIQAASGLLTLCETTCSARADIVRQLAETTPEQMNLLHVASCVGPEAGELFEGLADHIFGIAPVKRANVVEELGDLEFYLEAVRVALGVAREEVLAANIAKLRERYEKKTGVLTFTDTAAHERLDKVGREGFQMTRERRANNADWPQWLHEAWNKPHIQAGAVGPYVMDHGLMVGRLAVKMDDDRSGHPVEWGQWIVREPWGALVIESDFQPGQ